MNQQLHEPDQPEWTPQQIRVIQADPAARLLVDAGPGTGKTAVACARVAWLLSEGLDPGNIWLISFTRTAVQELKDRIRTLSNSDSQAAGVKISTLDSDAWHLLHGFDPGGVDRVFRSYEENIRDTIELLQEPSHEVRDYFDEVQHLIVDEAQDLVGDRCALIEAIVKLLAPGCGITVFSDDAQAIYGFSADDEDGDGYSGETLPARIRGYFDSDFIETGLTAIHRTDSDSLLHIFIDTRHKVLNPGEDPASNYQVVREEIATYGGDLDGVNLIERFSGIDDLLILFRRRAEALMESSFWLSEGQNHRLRMSGFSQRLRPWIALLLSEHTSDWLERREFEERWDEAVADIDPTAPERDAAWEFFLAQAGDETGRSRISLPDLRDRLSRSRPPVGSFLPEVGTSGPIIGTIHASKGREAPVVVLKRPTNGPGNNADEETRVLFVGATRARDVLFVGNGFGFPASNVNGRAVRPDWRKPRFRASVEVGRGRDVATWMQVNQSRFRQPEEAQETQRWLAGRVGEDPCGVQAALGQHRRYGLTADSAPGEVGVLDQVVYSDLGAAGRLAGSSKPAPRGPPRTIRYLHMIDVCSVVLADDDPRRELLHPPYDESGIYLAPVIVGFPTIFY